MNLPKQYSDLKEFRKVMFLYDSALKEVQTKIQILNNEFKMTNQYNPIEHVTTRIKTPQSITKKLRHNNKEFTIENMVKHINDIAGIRIICSFKTDIFRIADAISKQNDVKVLKIKDYITKPKENGYASYHMIVSVPIYLTDKVINTKVEIQIRTISMDYWASLEHKIYYKFEGNAPPNIKRELKECADIVGFLDEKMLSINEKVQDYSFNVDEEEGQAFTGKGSMIESFGNIYEEENSGQNQYMLNSSELLEIESDVRDVQDGNKRNPNYKRDNYLDKEKTNKDESKYEKLLKIFKLNTN